MNIHDLEPKERKAYLEELAKAKASYLSKLVFDPVVGLETRRFYPVLAGKIVMEPPSMLPKANESSSVDAIAVAQRVKLWAQRELEKMA